MSSSPTPSVILATATPHFLNLFLVPYVLLLYLLPATSTSPSHGPYFHKPVFFAVTSMAVCNGIAGLVALVGIGEGFSGGGGWGVAGGVLRTSGRFIALFSILYLLYRYGPRKHKHGHRDAANILSTSLVVFILLLIIASTSLSLFHDIKSSSSTSSSPSPSTSHMYLSFSIITLATVSVQLGAFILLACLDQKHTLSSTDMTRRTTTTTHSRIHSQHSQMYLTAKDPHSPLSPHVTAFSQASGSDSHATTASRPRSHRRSRAPSFSTTIRSYLVWIIGVQSLEVVSAAVQVIQFTVNDLSPAQEHTLDILRTFFEVLWITGVMYIYFVLSRPRPKPTDQEASHHHEELRHSSSPTPHRSSVSPSHDDSFTTSSQTHGGTTTNTGLTAHAYTPTHTIPGSISEEFLASASPDPFGSPAPGTTTFVIRGQSTPQQGYSRRRRRSEGEDSAEAPPPVPALPAEYQKATRILSLEANDARPAIVISAKSRRATGGGKLTLSLKRRRSAKQDKEKEKISNNVVAFRSEPSLVPTDRMRPARSSGPTGLDKRQREDETRSKFISVASGPEFGDQNHQKRSDGPPPSKKNRLALTLDSVPGRTAMAPSVELAPPSATITTATASPKESMISMYMTREPVPDGTRSGSPTPIALSKKPSSSVHHPTASPTRNSNHDLLSVLVRNILAQQHPSVGPNGSGSTTPTPLDRTPRASKVSSAVVSRQSSPGRIAQESEENTQVEELVVAEGLISKFSSDSETLLPAHVFRPFQVSSSTDSGVSPSDDPAASPLATPAWGTITSEQLVSPFPPTPERRREERATFQHPVHFSELSSSHPHSDPIPIPGAGARRHRRSLSLSHHSAIVVGPRVYHQGSSVDSNPAANRLRAQADGLGRGPPTAGLRL